MALRDLFWEIVMYVTQMQNKNYLINAENLVFKNSVFIYD